MNKFNRERFKRAIFSSEMNFDELAQFLWQYQRQNNLIIRDFCDQLNLQSPTFIPIEFFKHLEMRTQKEWEAEFIFESSGTTGQTPSRHYVKELKWYEEVSLRGFYQFFDQQPYCVLALLPSYLERNNSSLVQMVRHWIASFGTEGSGFFLHDFEALALAIENAKAMNVRILLIGVSFALLDFADQYGKALPSDTIVIETGGMKGRRAEMTRDTLHTILSKAFSIPHIVSEYGMTELLSQAYALYNGNFLVPPWMKIVISDIHLSSLPKKRGKTGRVNIIDLANIDSCAFIATDDIGRMSADGSVEILGRLDYAEIRGCNLMYQ